MGRGHRAGNAVLTSHLAREAAMRTIAGLCAREISSTKEGYAFTGEAWTGNVERDPFPEAVVARSTRHVH